jgi:uncharacterized protein (TIGR00730 family)
MQRICVFSGSNKGTRLEYQQAAQALGQELVARGLGLMGILADSVLANGSEVIGVIPRALFRREVVHTNLTALHEVGSMHERKALMADLADSFIALPGGFGTFDELFETITWAQLGIHTKPIGLLNAANYFDPLLALVEHASKEGFIPPTYTSLLLHEHVPAALLDAFAAYRPGSHVEKWSEPPPER